MKTKTVAADSLIPYIRNPRKNSAAVDKVAASIKEFGWQQPIVVDKENVIIAGHTRLLAAQKLGMDKVPVHVADLSDAQAKAYRLADNRISEDADWDIDLLGLEIRELDDLGFDLDLTGFDNTELANLLIDPDLGETDEDAVPEPPEEPISKPGDLWILGEHRLLCGDAGDEEAHKCLLMNHHVDLVLTDPPYGVGVAYNQFTDTKEQLDKLIPRFLPLIRRHDLVLLTPGKSNIWHYPEPTWTLVWAEPAGTGRGPWGFIGSQPVLAYGKCPYLANGLGSRPDTFIGKGEGASSDEHPVAKPIEVWEWFMERGSINKGDIIFDPFLGSGTTIIAAERLGRKCYGMELDPKYCDVIVKRWEQYTSEQATLRQREAA